MQPRASTYPWAYLWLDTILVCGIASKHLTDSPKARNAVQGQPAAPQGAGGACRKAAALPLAGTAGR